MGGDVGLNDRGYFVNRNEAHFAVNNSEIVALFSVVFFELLEDVEKRIVWYVA